MNKLLLIAAVLLPAATYAQELVMVPADISVVQLEADSEITNGRQTLQAAKGTYLVSEATVKNYLLYQTTLLRARDQLLNSKARIDTLMEALRKMEAKLAEVEHVSSHDLPADLEKLNELQTALEQANQSLSNSNNELESIKGDLEKTHKKLQKQGKGERFVRALVGGTALTAGILIGLLLAGGGS